ncbi:DNA-directed DNA polymerase, partial [Tanacetum coccineum]
PDLVKLTKAKIRDLFPEELLMMIFDKSNEPWNAQTKSYDDVSLETRLPIFFDNVIVVCREDIMGSPPRQEKSLKLGSTGLTSSAMHGIDFMGSCPSSNGNRFILVAIDYVSKLVEAQAFLTSDARNVVNELDELRPDAYESSISYIERTKRWHDKHINTPINYEKGDKVLLLNSHLRLFLGKLKSRWYGPFIISKDMKSGVIELRYEEGNEFIINKQRVEPFQKDMSGFDANDDGILDDEGRVT